MSDAVCLRLPAWRMRVEATKSIAALLSEFPGDVALIIELVASHGQSRRLLIGQGIDPCPELYDALDRVVTHLGGLSRK